MAKIPKNLTDKAMFSGVKEVETFETMFFAEEEPEVKPPPKTKANEKEDLATSFLTKELQEKLGKALLDLKLDLYKEGIVDYEIKIKREGQNILLVPLPIKKKEKVK